MKQLSKIQLILIAALFVFLMAGVGVNAKSTKNTEGNGHVVSGPVHPNHPEKPVSPPNKSNNGNKPVTPPGKLK